MKCVACGSTALVEVTLMDNSSGGTSVFKPKQLSIWKSMFGVGSRELSPTAAFTATTFNWPSVLARRICSVTSSLKASNRACSSE